MMEKGAVSKTRKRELSDESAAGSEPGNGSLEQIFYYLSELDLDIGHNGEQKASSG